MPDGITIGSKHTEKWSGRAIQTVTFTDSKNKRREVNFEAEKGDESVFKALSDASGNNNTDITPQKLYKMNESVYSNLKAKPDNSGYGSTSRPDYRLEEYDRLTKHYTDSNSPGGANITKEEQRLFMEKWGNSFGDK